MWVLPGLALLFLLSLTPGSVRAEESASTDWRRTVMAGTRQDARAWGTALLVSGGVEGGAAVGMAFRGPEALQLSIVNIAIAAPLATAAGTALFVEDKVRAGWSAQSLYDNLCLGWGITTAVAATLWGVSVVPSIFAGVFVDRSMGVLALTPALMVTTWAVSLAVQAERVRVAAGLRRPGPRRLPEWVARGAPAPMFAWGPASFVVRW